MMFGDVGGLYDFFTLILSSICGFFAQSFMRVSMVSKLFHAMKGKNRVEDVQTNFAAALKNV